jgi:WD40 repeat protein
MPGGQIVSGTQSGHLYVWEQRRDMALEVRYTDDGREVLPIRWTSAGSLVGIIPNAHDSPVLCISHDPTQPTTYMTAGKDGVLVAWNIGFNEQRKLIHAVVKTIDLPPEQTGGGFPCSLKYLAPFGAADSIAVGLTNNSILEVKVNTNELCLLITAHSGVLEAIAPHPFKPFYVTAGREKMVRVWDASARGLLCRAKIHAPASCCAWSPDGSTIVVGTTQGDFAVLTIGDDGGARTGLQSIMVKQLLRSGANNLAAKTELKNKMNKSKKKKEMTPLQRKMRSIQGEATDSPTGQKPFKRHEEVQDIKFSPDGTKLAIASRDNNIYLYAVEDEHDFQIIGVCRGHSSYVTHIDWSEDSTCLQSNDGTYELLYWDANTAKRVRYSIFSYILIPFIFISYSHHVLTAPIHPVTL